MPEGEYKDKELLLFQLGPVQEFIAQAATVGDLWAGSTCSRNSYGRACRKFQTRKRT